MVSIKREQYANSVFCEQHTSGCLNQCQEGFVSYTDK